MTLIKKESFQELNAIALGWKLSKKGYCSIDTRQDSSYFCNWVNVEELKVVTYCEGDYIETTGDNKEEFKNYLLEKIIKWYQDRKEFLGIDPELNEKKRDSLINFGLSNLIH
tara:strand:- start:1968 stop:2303 length:336 start_codon:yes stop_codon:yes gene_type:complete